MDRVKLRERLQKRLSMVELETVCFDLGIDPEDLKGETKPKLILSMLTLFEKRDRIDELIQWLDEWEQLHISGHSSSHTTKIQPYKGLTSFEEKDVGIFFGRTALTRSL